MWINKSISLFTAIILLLGIMGPASIGAAYAATADLATEQTSTVHELNVMDQPISVNPMRGFMRMYKDEENPAFQGKTPNDFPYTLEYIRLPVCSIISQEDGAPDWSAFETALNEAQAKGRNAVVRFYLDLPDDDYEKNPYSGLPGYLLTKGEYLAYNSPEKAAWDEMVTIVKTPGYTSEQYTAALNGLLLSNAIAIQYQYNAEDKTVGVQPNYFHPAVQQCILNFVTALAQEYDGDPRIASIEAGLLGPWGEWIASRDFDIIPHYGYWDDWRNNGAVVNKYSLYRNLIIRYNSVFENTHIQLREAHSLDDQSVGFHNDMFGLSSDSFLNTIHIQDAGMNWQAHPIGGELAPLFQTQGFGSSGNSYSFFNLSDGHTPAAYRINHKDYGSGTLDFERETQAQNTSWLLARETNYYTGQEYENALEASTILGYDFAITEAIYQDVVRGGDVEIGFTVRNRGVAPFYFQWLAQVELYDKTNMQTVTSVEIIDWDIRTVGAAGQDNDEATFATNIENVNLDDGFYGIRLLFANPMQNGRPIIFANEESEQNGQYTGWIELGSFHVNKAGGEAPVPDGFAYVEGTVDTGFVIEDDNQNQYVWVPVPHSSPHLVEKQEGTAAYNEMVASVKHFGGFYIGRYETGSLWGSTSVPVVVKPGNAQIGGTAWQTIYNKSAALYADSKSITGGMIWDEQWDAVIDWFGGEPVPGNYKDCAFDYISSGAVKTKAAGTEKIIPSGSNDNFNINHIYDLSGNVWEMTVSASNQPYRRGGGYKQLSTQVGITATAAITTTTTAVDVGSRMQLFLKLVAEEEIE